MNYLSGERHKLPNGWFVERRGYGKDRVNLIHDRMGNEVGFIDDEKVDAFIAAMTNSDAMKYFPHV